MNIAKQVLAKMTTRNILATSTTGIFLYIVQFIITSSPQLLENPLVTGILGAFTTVVVMIYVFYFRTSGTTGLTSEGDELLSNGAYNIEKIN